MRSTRRIALVLILSISVCGCGAIRSWVDLIQQNPIAGIQDAITGVGTAVQMAEAVFDLLAGQSPEVAAQRATFQRYVADVIAGLDLARSSLHVVQNATSGDIERILSSSFDALDKLYRFIATLRQHIAAERLTAALPGGSPGEPVMTVAEYYQRGLEVMRHALPPSHRAALNSP
jgi:hypothetical protein